jgi:hypothetical protein
MLLSGLALVVVLAAAVPVFAQNITEIGGFRFKPGDCGNREGRDFTQAEAEQFLINRGLDPDRLPDVGNVCLLNPPGGDGGDGGRGGGGGAGGGGGGGGEGISQETDLSAESGDLDQDFSVEGSGDNSNQCANIQGVGNPGNAQNVIDVIQYASEVDDLEFDEVGSTIDVSPTNTATCDQTVSQAATAAA